MIEYKSPRELQIMHRANAVVLETLAHVSERLAPGITTDDLDRMAEEFIRKQGALPAFKGYRGYPKSLCISVNDEVVHGIPGRRMIEAGDLVSIDCGAIVDGYVGDNAMTFPIGEVSELAHKLMRVTRESLFHGISAVVDGNRLGDIGYRVQSHAEANGFSVVRSFVGHGIGRKMHEEPQVPNYGRAGYGKRLQVGLVVAIEPMINVGGPDVTTLDDDWTAVTLDGTLSAHFEHSVAVTPDGPWILGRNPGPIDPEKVLEEVRLSEAGAFVVNGT